MSTPPNYTYGAGVYFARCGKYVKIGYSSDPARRIKSLLASGKIICPADLDRGQPIELLHVIGDCRMRDERIIHGLFAAHRVEGEWFRLSLPFLNQLANLRYQTDRARARYAFLYRAEMKRIHLRSATADRGAA